MAAADVAESVAVSQDWIRIQTSLACYSNGDCERVQLVAVQSNSTDRPTTNASDDHTVDTRIGSRKPMQTPLVPASIDSLMNLMVPERCYWHRSSWPAVASSDFAART